MDRLKAFNNKGKTSRGSESIVLIKAQPAALLASLSLICDSPVMRLKVAKPKN